MPIIKHHERLSPPPNEIRNVVIEFLTEFTTSLISTPIDELGRFQGSSFYQADWAMVTPSPELVVALPQTWAGFFMHKIFQSGAWFYNCSCI